MKRTYKKRAYFNVTLQENVEYTPNNYGGYDERVFYTAETSTTGWESTTIATVGAPILDEALSAAINRTLNKLTWMVRD